MDTTVRAAGPTDITRIAHLIEEIEGYYGSTDIQPLEQRVTQVEEALFGPQPLASALLAEDEHGEVLGFAAYSFLWPAAGSTHSLFLKELYVREVARRRGVGAALMDAIRLVSAPRERRWPRGVRPARRQR